ncbi:hypothetical protein N7532_008970 [Penicillium argentinense]|uniref:Uncharacterized protein n=1 Tax=Penicillium argentinense TaxID=1131581 RepID=A0A9W9K2J5_9EURO|nr:uncharacterized protein N7532_008970 [Penicillium argentinense]KAJ5090286.1 hypothetical protein N7532_008970 [Penicillium argentinense]
MVQAAEGSEQGVQRGEIQVSTSRKRAREPDMEDDGDTPRKGGHGKRLTTKEEVSLLGICNRHAGKFGRRSDICNWWKLVAEEFTKAHGRPYSWYSVRRKVELVTKQRMKFLDEQQQRQRDFSGQNPVEDVMNPEWCAALDAWIPVWQRWEEAEAKRIAKRDEMVMRKRSNPKNQDGRNKLKGPGERILNLGVPSFGPPDGMGLDTGNPFHEDMTIHPTVDNILSHSTPTLAHPPVAAPFETPSPLSNSLRLPPGFADMFSNPYPASQPSPIMPVPTNTGPAAPVTNANNTHSEPSNNNPVFNAVLETLGKLNKHLDAASGNGATDAHTSPVISALVQAASESNTQSGPPQENQEPQERDSSQNANSLEIGQIKEDLRKELREELRQEFERERAVWEEKFDSVQRTQEMILEMLRQEPT